MPDHEQDRIQAVSQLCDRSDKALRNALIASACAKGQRKRTISANDPVTFRREH